MKLNLLLKFWLLITIKLTAAGQVCDEDQAKMLSQSKLSGSAYMCGKLSFDLYDCLSNSSNRQHSHYSCFVCTTPSCENGNIYCGRGSSMKELHWSLDVFEGGFYTYNLSKSGFIKVVQNNEIFNKTKLSNEKENRNITITLKECTNTTEGKEDCIANRSEAHENIDPVYSCIFVAIGYQNASTKNNDSMMMLFEKPDYKYDANQYTNGCLIQDEPKTTIKTTITTSTVTELQTSLTSTTVEIPLPDIEIPTISIEQGNPPVIENVQVTLPPLPVITIGNATLIRNISNLNKLNLTAFVKIAGPDSLAPSYLLAERNPNNFLITLKNNSFVDVSQYQLSSPQKVKKKKKSISKTGATDTFSSGTKSLVIILNKYNLLLLFVKFL